MLIDSDPAFTGDSDDSAQDDDGRTLSVNISNQNFSAIEEQDEQEDDEKINIK